MLVKESLLMDIEQVEEELATYGESSLRKNIMKKHAPFGLLSEIQEREAARLEFVTDKIEEAIAEIQATHPDIIRFFIAYYQYGKSGSEVAMRLGITEDDVYDRRARLADLVQTKTANVKIEPEERGR